MDAICCCFQQNGSPMNSDNDDEQSEKWGLIAQQLENEKRLHNRDDDEKVKENDAPRSYDMVDTSDEDIDDEEADDDDDDVDDDDLPSFQSDPSKTRSFNLSEIQTKYDPLLEDTPSTFDPLVTSVTSVSTAGYTWDIKEDEHSTSLQHMDSLASHTSALDSGCPQCVHLLHMQKQFEIQIETIRERNNELEDKVVDAQNSEENIQRAYDELKEDLDRMKNKYQLLMKSSEETKIKHENVLHEMRNKFENDMKNLEKNYQDMIREKNAMELTLNEKHEKLGKLESDLMNSQNAFSTLNVQKSRIEEDLKIQEKKMQNVMNQHAEKMELFQKERNDLLEKIKEQNTRSVTEKENNELTSNILKDQIKSLHGEIAELEEEKKALLESVALYEQQMNAAQLIDDISSDVNDGSDNDGIPEDEEMEDVSVRNVIYGDYKKRNSKSNNMSISELEPAFSRLPFKASASEEVDDDDSVYINYDIDPPQNKKLSTIKSNSPLLGASSPRLPLISADTPPIYELQNEDSLDPDDVLSAASQRMTRPHSRSKGDASLPVIAEKRLGLSIKGAQSLGDLISASPTNPRTKSSPSGQFGHGYSASATFQGLNVWKDRYAELKSEKISNAKQVAQQEIELKSLRDKMKLLEAVIDEDVHKIDSLTSDLENVQRSYMELHTNEDKLRKEHEIEINKLSKEVNAARDEIATLSTENERYSEYRKEKEKDIRKKEKLHTKQLKFNEAMMNEIFDLNNEVKQLTDMNVELKSKLETVLVENAQAVDDYEAMKRKLAKTARGRKEEQKEHTRLKNKVSSLNKEVVSLNRTITNLESLFAEHSNQIMSKNKRIKHLGKQREAQQQSIHRLSSKLKKRERHMKGFLLAEENSFKKSHNAKDKRLNMLRETNKKLVTRLEDTEKKILELKSTLRETKNKLKEEVENRRMASKTLQVEISKLTTDHNTIVMEKQEIEYQRDNAVKMNKELLQQMEINKQTVKRTIKSMIGMENDYRDVLMFLDSMQMKEDELYKFVDRCRNTLINTNKLTKKLTTQLIEGCDRAICVYFNAVSYFKLFIEKCLGVKQRFKNIEEASSCLEFHSYEIYQSALCSIYNIGGSSSAASNVVLSKRDSPRFSQRDSLNINRSTRKILNAKNKDVIPKIPLIAKDLIRKPVQSETAKVPIAAYNQICDLLSKHIENALNDLRKVTANYSKPLNVSIYNQEEEEEEDDDDDDSQVGINWNKLTIDPSTERVYPGLKERNDKRFEEIMHEFNESSKEFRTEQTKQLMQLNGAWHQYNIAVGPNNDLSPKLCSKSSYEMSAVDETTAAQADTASNAAHQYVSPLTLNVSSHGTHSKRYSIF